ncbi:dTMP kinase [Neolewinella antarctica]|uniref:Thymidylate kinase n=1 Tax=Neolewinella antarctica TaxID=442734 RepID=A0ABX0X6V4_9BACT|nr:dTMP kinase [Neolewinella antarctica]NJC24726.1 dTMP kinase [Neolewinella antarctica]
MSRPLFIVVEGLDGSGKTTQLDLLKDQLQGLGQACYVTAEPTELPTGKFLRSIMRGEVSADNRTIAALYAADRLEHLFHPEEGILAKLAAGYHVISSRYYFSSLAYQSELADPNWIASLNMMAKRTLPADLTLFLDLTPEESLARISGRGEQAEIYENREKLVQVREGFHLAFQHFGEGERIRPVNAAGTVAEVADAVWSEVIALLEE